MSNNSSPTARTHPDAEAHPRQRITQTDGSMRSKLLRLAVLPAAIGTAVAVAAAVVIVVAEGTPSIVSIVALIVAIVAGLIAAFLAASRAAIVGEQLDEQVASVRPAIASQQREIQEMIDDLRHGQRPQPRQQQVHLNDDEFASLANDLERLRSLAVAAIEYVLDTREGRNAAVVPAETAPESPSTPQPPAPAPAPQPEAVEAPSSATPLASGSDSRVGVFVNLARRLQSLVHREIQMLDKLEAEVEDPELLKGLFAVDHLATRIRRHAENLAVLGGAVPRRQWSRPINVYEVLRSAVAEVEQYSRVKLVRPIEGQLKGHAVADIIHLVAELVENATRFSAPSTQVLLRAQTVTAGVAIEVEDRGLGMPREDQQRFNAILANPHRVDIDDLLEDGRIGLYVVSSLAQRYGVAVQLQTNIYGGIQAAIVLPSTILGGENVDEEAMLPADSDTNSTQPLAVQSRSDAPVSAQPVSAQPTSAQPVSAQPLSAQPVAAQSAAGAPTEWPPPPEWSTPQRRPSPGPMSARNGGGRGVPSAGRGDYNPVSAPPSGAPAMQPAQAPGYRHNAPTTPSYTDADERPAMPPAASGDDRPALPRRRKQANLAPQLANEPAEAQEPQAGHNPNLMSAFQRGFSSASESADDTERSPYSQP